MNAEQAREEAEKAFREVAPKPPTLGEVRSMADRCGKTGSDDAKKAVMVAWRQLDDDDRAISCKSIATAIDVRVGGLRQCEAPAGDSDDGGDDLTQADRLVAYAEDFALFIDARGEAAFADVEINGHRETHKVDSKSFRDVLRSRYYADNGKAARGEVIAQAVATIEARALFASPVVRHEVHLRSANVGSAIYIDSGREDWSAIKVTADGFGYDFNPDVRFRRTKESLPMPEFMDGGSVGDLLPLINVKSPADFILTVAFLLQVLRGKPKYVHPVLRGEQGSGKSAYTVMVRSLVDPANSDLRSPPRNEDDLFCAAQAMLVLAFDNLTSVPQWLSDAFCRMGDGGSLGKRTHYENDLETVLRGGRPMIFNGISEAITAGDLADRAMFINLEPIPEAARIDDDTLVEMQDRARPRIFGALLRACMCGLRNLPTTTVKNMPRMATFARWVAACEPALVGTVIGKAPDGTEIRWEEGNFLAAYRGNRAGAAESVLDADVVASELRAWLPTTAGWTGEPKEWSGTSTVLFQDLGRYADRPGGPAKTKGWPTSATGMSDRIRRAAPALRRVGIDFSEKRRATTRILTLASIARPETASVRPSVSSASSTSRTESAEGQDDLHDGDDASIRGSDAMIPNEGRPELPDNGITL
ncbi:MAG TPA: hypothetical protein VGK20_08915 [Candidatus Binatia bacterium]